MISVFHIHYIICIVVYFITKDAPWKLLNVCGNIEITVIKLIFPETCKSWKIST